MGFGERNAHFLQTHSQSAAIFANTVNPNLNRSVAAEAREMLLGQFPLNQEAPFLTIQTQANLWDGYRHNLNEVLGRLHENPYAIELARIL